MRLKNGFIFLLINLLFSGCFLNSKEYKLYAVIKKTNSADLNSKVVFEGEDIGRVSRFIVLDSDRVLLELSIKDGFRIPESATLKYRENILGDTYLDISYNAAPGNRAAYSPGDTLSGTFIPLKKIDTNSQKRIIDKLRELKNTVDSAVKTEDSE